MVHVFENSDPELMIISISACMAGAVCGDHCSPISDTIMASAGAQCDHVNHVSTQLPYAVSVAVISFVTYLVAGFVRPPGYPAGGPGAAAGLFGSGQSSHPGKDIRLTPRIPKKPVKPCGLTGFFILR